MPANRVLHQADDGAGQQAGNRIPPGHGKENGHQEGQIEVGEKWKPPGHERLQEQGQQRHAHGYRQTEPVNLNLLP